MNYTMGRYIDELDDEGRDRLVTAEDFTLGSWWDGRCGCLVATGEGATGAAEAAEAARARGMIAGLSWAEDPPAYRYPYAVDRFGKDRVVRAIKLRAGATLPPLASPAESRALEEVPEP